MGSEEDPPKGGEPADDKAEPDKQEWSDNFRHMSRTIPILVSLWAGETRFNDLRRAIGSISPALLSRRLKEMEEKGLVTRVEERIRGRQAA